MPQFSAIGLTPPANILPAFQASGIGQFEFPVTRRAPGRQVKPFAHRTSVGAATYSSAWTFCSWGLSSRISVSQRMG